MVIDQPLLVRGKGAALLHLSAAATPGTARTWELLAGIGAIGAVSLVAMLLLYRRARARLLTLSLIRESLLAAAAGTSDLSPEALSLRPDLGPEAQAWNELLEQTEKLRRAGLADRVRESLGALSPIGRTVPGQMPLSDPATPPPAGAELESACDALAVGMIVVDANGSARHVNGAAAALLQLRRDQMLSKPIGELIGDQAVRDAVQGIIRGSGQRRTFELRREDDQGGGILRVHVRPLRRDDCGGALVTIEDITQQRVADAARNSFVAQATHELRTPLTNMRLCLEAALDDKQTDPAVLREHFNILSHETRRLERMVGEMLSMAEIEAGSLQLKSDDVRLEKVFDELQADYRPQAAEKRIELVFDLPPKLPVIVGDRDKLLVTLHNLVGNALKYTPAGGKVTVAVRVEGASAQMLVIDVIDTGIGISPEEQPKIFAKFYRAKDPRVGKITGTGLGLALAREIARLHGGDITVQSELDKGSTFTLTLPARAAQAKAA
jgi:PAS domain S-box-containing protein